jgi:predicted CXXCH cytochrome family protein
LAGCSTRARWIAIGATLSIVAVAALVAWRSGALRGLTDLASRAGDAYHKGQWAAAEREAREVLKVHPDEPSALRVLARSSARLGRDDAAIALYSLQFGPGMMEAEDYILLGLALQRRGRPDAATRAWEKAIHADPIPPRSLEELARILIQFRRREEAAQVAERLARQPGWEARGEMLLGTIRAGFDDVAGAAESFRLALERDPKELDNSADPVGLGKLVARTFLRVGRAAEARAYLQAILSRMHEPESWWLLSRAYLQEGDRDRAREALARSGTYRSDHPMEAEPSPYVGEARCESCHARIFRDSLASRHTRSYYRGDQLNDLPRPERPLPDPDDPNVTHAYRLSDGSLREETRVGSGYLTMVGRDARGNYRIARLSYYDTADGRGWDRSALDKIHPARGDDSQGEAIGVRDGVAKCLYFHATNPRSGRGPTGPEASDRAIGCERCHGPGGHHLAAVAAGLPDMAIANPATAGAQLVTATQCNDCHILRRDFREDVLADASRVRSQGVGWTFSRCNTESGGTFGCVTCHDPHKPSRSTTTARYEAKCLSCHSSPGPSKRSCPINPSKDCLGCHMPRIRIDPLHLSLTDHYIRVR